MDASTSTSRARLKVGVVGCGHLGTIHAEAVRSSPLAELVGVCDIELRQRQKINSLYPGVPVYENVADLLEASKLDVVTIATPDHLHSIPAISAANKGCHVFVEKPMAMSLSEARAMAEAARYNDRQMAVDYNRRFGFAYRKAVDLVKNNAIGTVKQITINVSDGVPTCAQERGQFAILYLLLTHHIDLLRMIGGEIESISAQMTAQLTDQIDAVNASFQHKSGALSQLSGAWITGQNRTEEKMIITGSGGVITVDDVLRSVRIRRLDPDVIETHCNSVFTSEGTFYDTVKTHLHSFLSAVSEDRLTEANAIDGVRCLEIIEEIIALAPANTRLK